MSSSSTNKEQTSLKHQADSFFQKQDYKKAIEFYTQAIEVDPSCEAAAALFSNRSLCHHKLDNFEEALNDGVSATSIRPTWSRGYLRVATAAESLLQIEKAIEAYEKCLELDSSATNNNNNDEIKQKYLNLFKKHVENLSAKKTQDELKLFGNEYFSKQKYEEAIIIYMAAIDLDPSVEAAAAIYSNRSLCHFNTGKFEQAYEDGTMASVLRPDWPRGWLRRATAAMKIEKWQDASEAYDKYFKLDPSAANEDQESKKSRALVKKMLQDAAKAKKERQALIKHRRGFLSGIDCKDCRLDQASRLLQDGIFNYRDIDVCKLAIEFGADLNAKFLIDEGKPSEYDLFSISTELLREDGIIGKHKPLILFLISEFVRQKKKFTTWALTFACNWSEIVTPDPDIILAILQTKLADPNAPDPFGRLPLQAMMGTGAQKASTTVPDRVIDSLRVLLNFNNNEVQVNKKGRSGPQGGVMCTGLFMCHFAEINKILIRYGGDVNATTVVSRTGELTCPLHEALLYSTVSAGDPRGCDNLRVLIGAGAKFIPNGRDGRCSIAFHNLFSRRPDGMGPCHPTEEALQILLQAIKNQGLEFCMRDPRVGGEEKSILNNAIDSGAPVRLVELVCGMDPSWVDHAGVGRSGRRHMPPLIRAIWTAGGCGYRRFQPDTVQVLDVLLQYGADLNATAINDRGQNFGTVFGEMVRQMASFGFPLSVLEKLIIKKRGQAAYEECVEKAAKFKAPRGEEFFSRY